MRLAELTSPEVANLPKDIVVVAPLASVEQHSLHLPVFTDSLIAEEVARRLEARIPDEVLVLPVMWFGYSQHHGRYPGTLSARSASYLDLLMDLVSAVVDHGFRKVLIVNTHGGNEVNISVLLQRLMEKYEDADVFATTPYSGPAEGEMEKIMEAGPRGSGHAGETETSMILALRPDLVKTDRLQADGHCGRLNLPGVRNYRRFDRRTSHGGLGDPRSATAEKGERFFKVAEDHLADVVRKIREGSFYEPI